MFGLLNRFFRHEKGIAATELALVTPIFLMLFLSVTELGNMIYYSITIEKGMRSAVTYAARNKFPLDPAVIANTENLARTGSLDPNAPPLVAGFANPSSSVTISTKSYQKTMTGQSADVNVPVVVLSVSVPYVPLMKFVTENYFGNFNPTIKLTHEQAMIGD